LDSHGHTWPKSTTRQQSRVNPEQKSKKLRYWCTTEYPNVHTLTADITYFEQFAWATLVTAYLAHTLAQFLSCLSLQSALNHVTVQLPNAQISATVIPTTVQWQTETQLATFCFGSISPALKCAWNATSTSKNMIYKSTKKCHIDTAPYCCPEQDSTGCLAVAFSPITSA